MNILINLDFLKLNALPIIAGLSFIGGLFTSHLYHSAVEAHQTKVLLAQVQKQKDLDNKVIAGLQGDLTTLQKSYIAIGEKIRETKLTVTPCTITTDGIRLWNQSDSLTPDLPTDTKRASESTPTSSGVSAEELFQNKLENDKICNGIRLQLEAIIKWDKETYGY